MAKVPPSDTYLFTRTQVPPVTTPTRDPCNFPETYKPRHEAVNLWASLQTKGEGRADGVLYPSCGPQYGTCCCV